ncbi:hypothetical protein Q4567_00160 [Aliiglaciecola sp. 2_MG-2023]|uniref:hypothetical protein n=1 Tax=unclassified Aliiglaciecola TaxID=2593648 RepID=UPI0026E26A5F|nr:MULTISPECIES: hypothetical protein [unclassified Aliiglaciecola]MDO6709120.1 hypothetical protein [Aliiglaciecola sp. 2_MG-2023]MDO6750268.1 hypothetical protein [Aliiglaciecola sp. 1_MG-2023]
MEWLKKGRIFVPDGHNSLAITHAQVPVPVHFPEENRIRIFFSCRDSQSRSRPFYIDVDDENPKKILKLADKPILELGALGTFDDCGVMPSWIVEYNDIHYMYYIGWNVRNTIPYHNAVGLAISEDNCQTFKKYSTGPLWDRDYIEPHYSGTSCVLIENGVWKNWYLSCTEWRKINGIVEPRYHIKYAESLDGIVWKRKGLVAIDYLDDNEAGIVKASVLKEDSIYKMWFSFRKFDGYRENINASYRIGYAESKDGINWQRFDTTNSNTLDVSKDGWDSLMVEYPHVFRVKEKLMMLYNGNGFGATGFGFAVKE